MGSISCGVCQGLSAMFVPQHPKRIQGSYGNRARCNNNSLRETCLNLGKNKGVGLHSSQVGHDLLGVKSKGYPAI